MSTLANPGYNYPAGDFLDQCHSLGERQGHAVLHGVPQGFNTCTLNSERPQSGLKPGFDILVVHLSTFITPFGLGLLHLF